MVRMQRALYSIAENLYSASELSAGMGATVLCWHLSEECVRNSLLFVCKRASNIIAENLHFASMLSAGMGTTVLCWHLSEACIRNSLFALYKSASNSFEYR